MNPTIQIFPNLEELSRAAAHLFVRLAKEAVLERGRFLATLSGGGTPQTLYRLLSQPPFAEQMPWARTHLFWGDERLVPPEHPESSHGMTARLLLNHVPIPPENVHRALGEVGGDTAVADYITQLAQLNPPNPWPLFDLVLLGMGHDGHTASLFPGPITLAEQTEPVIAVTADYEGRPAQRLSFTPLVINDARHILFLATGAKKAAALHAVLEGLADPQTWPAQRIQPHNGTIIWLVDEAAARQLAS
jgi:6-phosphogluconolactonase